MSGDAAAPAPAAPVRPLEGLTVVSIEQYGAAPFGTMYLADLGADVIKIENHKAGGEMGRHVLPYAEDGDSLFYQTFSCNKRCIALDLKKPRGPRFWSAWPGARTPSSTTCGRSAGHARARLCEPRRRKPPPRLRAPLGLRPRQRARRLPGLDYVMQAEAGYLSMTGEPIACPPDSASPSSISWRADCGAGTRLRRHAGACHRPRHGHDTPLYDVAMNNLSYPATWHLNEGFEPARVARSGHPSLVPSELYRTADGWIFVMANKANFWPALCKAMERPEWIDDPLMRDFAARYENRDEVVRRLEAVFLTRTTEAWLERLSGVLPCAPVNDVAGALASGFAAERRIVQEVPHPERGTMRMVRQPITVDGAVLPRRAAPALGADTAAILAELGYAPAEIEALAADGTVQRDHRA